MQYSTRVLDKDNVLSLQGLTFDQAMLKQGQNKKFGYYCPVTWKNEKQILKCHLRM